MHGQTSVTQLVIHCTKCPRLETGAPGRFCVGTCQSYKTEPACKMATLVSLKLTSAGRLIERSLVVPQCITLYNLHRVIQYALVPSISDDRVDAMVREKLLATELMWKGPASGPKKACIMNLTSCIDSCCTPKARWRRDEPAWQHAADLLTRWLVFVCSASCLPLEARPSRLPSQPN